MNTSSSMSTAPTVELDVSALRSQTEAAHRAVERALALPEAIGSLDDYARWLTRFLGIYAPLEAQLGRFTEWAEWGICIGDLGHARSLRQDLAALASNVRVDELSCCDDLPPMGNFGEALGALYVIEGSKLGGRFILKEISSRLGSAIDGATAFVTGHGGQAGIRWSAFKESLNAFLARWPEEYPSVVAGAESTFASIRVWMSPLNDKATP